MFGWMNKNSKEEYNMNQTCQMILKANLRDQWEDIAAVRKFVKSLRISLRLEHGMKAEDVSRLKDERVIELWYTYNSLPENRIGGAG
jgi:hypothetical protein